MMNYKTALAASLGFAATAWLAQMPAFAADAPAGSYSGSCRNVSADDRTLTAECKKTDGSWNQTELRGYHRCIGDISNNNGALECQKAEREGGGARGGSDSTGGGSGGAGASPGGGSGGSGAGASTGRAGGSSPGGSGGAPGAGGTSSGSSRSGSDTAGAGGSGGGRGAGGSTGGTSTGGSSTVGSPAGGPSSGGSGGATGGAGSTSGGSGNSGAPTGGPSGGSPPSNAGSSILPGEGPSGSYQQSCRNVQVRRGDLFAECKTRSGDWRQTTLENVRDCRGDISNDNGQLTCRQDDSAGDRRGDRDRDSDRTDRDSDRSGRDRGDSDRGGSDRDGGWDRGDRDGNDGREYDRGYSDEPRGSYLQSCERVRVRHGDLRAACRTRDGDWRWSSLENYQDCRGDIANNDGRLVCVRFGRITLYEHSGFRGDRRSFNSDAEDLGRFADRASSAYVQGGVWQLCTRRFFRGRCVTVDRSIGNFAPLGINDRIESVRRLR